MPDVFSPVKIGGVQLKNRIMMAPMETGLAEEGGFIGDRLITYFVERAKNEVAVVVTGSVACSPEGRGLPRQLSCYDDSFLPGLERLAGAVHKAGSKIAGQIYHAGRQATRAITGLEPLAPSAIPCPVMNDMPREMTEGDMEIMIEKFGRGAARLMKAGFDMVEVHLAHGYLLFGFLSPFSNKRNDGYGGSLANRLRFPLQVIRRIREEVGSSMAVTARLSVDEFVEGGLTFAEAGEICRAIAGEGVQAISISAGSYISVATIIQPMSFPRGFLVNYAEQVKKMVDVPVIVAGRINSPDILNEIISLKKADMVALGRALVCDPGFAVKMKEGRAEDIRPCVACNQGCIDRVLTGGGINCLQNARAGMESERLVEPAAPGKKIMVVGGGPSGMEASRVAALRGHTVWLVEKEGRLGGKVPMASMAPGKEEFVNVAGYLERSIRKLGVKIILGEPDPERVINEFRPDTLILAAGSDPVVPDIPGIEGDNVVTAEDILNGRAETGQRVVIIGGGKVGMETALYLAKQGKGVTVAEMTGEVAADMGPIIKAVLLSEIQKNNVAVLVNARVREVTVDGPVIQREGGHEKLAADTVVLATGYRPACRLLIDRPDIKTLVTGDAVEVRNAFFAIHDGFLAGAGV